MTGSTDRTRRRTRAAPSRAIRRTRHPGSPAGSGSAAARRCSPSTSRWRTSTRASPLYAGVEDAVTVPAARVLAAARESRECRCCTPGCGSSPGRSGRRAVLAQAARAAGVRGRLARWPSRTPAVAPTAGRGVVVIKQYASGFFGTSLASTLRQRRGSTPSLIVGVSTSGCVRATALDALQRGFVPCVAADAVGDRHTARTRPTCSTCRPSMPRSSPRRRRSRA